MNIRATILAGLALVGASLSVSAQAQDQAYLNETEIEWLEAHNVEREAFGSAPLTWNYDLAQQAYQWALYLAETGTLEHSTREQRGGAGENLWMGTAARFSANRMIQAFAREKTYFRAGTFPYVSTTGHARDVGHYTQIVWTDTREVGCAMARNHGHDVLVCRYFPAGNVVGRLIAPQQRLTRR